MTPLDPVQVAAIDFAKSKRGVGWFLQQGLGKSLCALTEFWRLFEAAEVEQMLIVCPNSFKQGWVDEIEKHGFSFSTHIFQSVHKAKAGVWLRVPANRPKVLIINYEAIRLKDVLKGLRYLVSTRRTYFAIDESIQIKGHRSLQTLAVHNLAPLCTFVRLLTGRPQTQGPHDLWGQLRAIGLFPDRNFYAFRGSFCEMGGYLMKQVMAARNAEGLALAMAPAVFQAKKKDWLPELPRKDATIRDYVMSNEQMAQYRSMEKEFLLALDSGEYVTVSVAIAKYEKLAQIQVGFIYDENGETHELVHPTENPRLRLLLQLLEEEVEGKAVVVYRHKAAAAMLLRALSRYDCAWIKGRMTPEETSEQKERFNTDPSCRVLLAQAEATRYGHTLLGGPGEDDRCRTMIFFENSYSADTRDQIEDRIHRRGQTGERVLYVDLSGSALDRRIVKALQRKEHLYQSVFRNLREAAPA